MAGNKIPILMIKNIKKLLDKSIPAISTITEKTGIRNIGQPNMQMPGSCLPQEEVKKLSDLRNNIVNQLNSTARTIQTLKRPINTLSRILNVTKTGLKVAKTSRLAANAILLALNPPIVIPGAIPAGINTLKDLDDLLRPIITKTSNSIDYILIALDYAESTIFNLLKILEPIDQYLTGCGITSSELTSTSDFINQINQQYSELNANEIYKEFTLEIVEEPYTPTVNRRKAVAKNKNNIILLSTPLSFTTEDQILIEQLKLLIDSNDLKAD